MNWIKESNRDKYFKNKILGWRSLYCINIEGETICIPIYEYDKVEIEKVI